MGDAVQFGGAKLDAATCFVRRRSLAGTVEAAARGEIEVLVVDARAPRDLARAHDLLRALFDDPRRPRRVLDPSRVLALVAAGDVEAAFAFGRYGIAGVLDELGELDRRVERARASIAAPLPLAAPLRPARLTRREDGELPTVVIGYRHAPETLAGLDRYCRALSAHADRSTVFADVATLIDVMVREGITCQTLLATKAGATSSGQYIGSFEFYREVRRTRYGRIPAHPSGAIEMDVFIAIDEVLHEVLHLLYLANHHRAGLPPRHPLVAEEIHLTWWQAIVHHRVFPEWIADRAILEINDDFLLDERNAEPFEFWKTGNVFDAYAHYPWVRYAIAQLPERASYIGARPDLAAWIATVAERPEAAFLAGRDVSLELPFDAYPPDLPGALLFDA